MTQHTEAPWLFYSTWHTIRRRHDSYIHHDTPYGGAMTLIFTMTHHTEAPWLLYSPWHTTRGSSSQSSTLSVRNTILP